MVGTTPHNPSARPASSHEPTGRRPAARSNAAQRTLFDEGVHLRPYAGNDEHTAVLADFPHTTTTIVATPRSTATRRSTVCCRGLTQCASGPGGALCGTVPFSA